MKIAVNSLHWDNLDPRMTAGHKKVYEHFGIPVAYTHQNFDHGEWMTHICKNVAADIFVFVDADCVPICDKVFQEGIDYCVKTGGFVGPAQASNHFGHPVPSHVFASPAFFMIPKQTYMKLRSPSFSVIQGRSDAAQELSRKADDVGIPYRCWHPTKYEHDLKTQNPLGYDTLGNYGRYGIGTVFGDNKIYHLYEGRKGKNVDRFEQRCTEIVQGNFTGAGMLSSTSLLP